MSWSQYIEEKRETNAYGRASAAKPKIITKEKYQGLSPGKLHLSVNFSGDCLYVDLEKAEDLYGKKSQDPYANVYLLDSKSGMCYFQKGNNKTETFSKNLDPKFNTRFEFRMGLSEIVNKSLVIAIWDHDSTSRDDYMAGIRLNLRDVQYFNRKGIVAVDLQHQESDGHPAAFDNEQSYIRRLFEWKIPAIGSSLDLKTCNNHLVSFIERARVLAEAYDFKANMPDSLTNTVSVMPPDVREMFRMEITRYQSKFNSVRAERAKFEAERNNLRMDNQQLKVEKKKKTDLLASRRQEHFELEVVHAELTSKCGSLDYLQEKIQRIEERIRIEQERTRKSVSAVPGLDVSISEVTLRESMRDMPGFGSAGRGDTSSQSLSQEYEIRVRTEYEQRIRDSLDKKRGQYQTQYHEFIVNIERDAAEIIRLYEDILREKFNPSNLHGLLAIWDKRGYQARINLLMGDIEELRRKIQLHGTEEARLKKWYEDELARLEAKLQLLMKNLRDLFSRFTEFTSARYSEFSEVSIFNQLLDYEDQRLAAARTKVEVKVRSTASRSSHAAKAGFSLPVASSYTSSSSQRRMTGESGYSSPMKTPDGILDRQDSYSSSFEQSRGYSQSGGSSYRQSRGSTNSMMSDTLERIKNDVK